MILTRSATLANHNISDIWCKHRSSDVKVNAEDGSREEAETTTTPRRPRPPPPHPVSMFTSPLDWRRSIWKTSTA